MYVDMEILFKFINFWDEFLLIRKIVGICFSGMGWLLRYWFFLKLKKKIECRKIIIICSLECNWYYYVIFKGIYLYMNFKIC